MVVRVDARVGEIVGPQSRRAIVAVCPDETRIVRCEADQEFAERVKPGQVVTILDDSGATDVWPGRVRSVAEWYAEPRLTSDEPGQPPSSGTLECVIEFDPGQPVPRLGRRVRALIAADAP